MRRRGHGIETVNVLRGGEYFFMPTIAALNWVVNLGRLHVIRIQRPPIPSFHLISRGVARSGHLEFLTTCSRAFATTPTYA